MTLQERIRDQREKVGRLLKDAQALGAARGSEPDDAKKAEAAEKFDKGYALFLDAKKELDRLEGELAIEAQLADMNQPENQLRYATDEEKNKRMRDTHNRSFGSYLRHGAEAAHRVLVDAGYGPDQINALLGIDDPTGGYLVPDDFRAEVLRAQAGFAVFRQAGARAIPTGRDTLVFPTVTAGTDPYSSDVTSGNSQTVGGSAGGYNWKPAGYVTGGTIPPQQTKPTFGQERVPVHMWQPDAVELDWGLVQDSVTPLDNLLAELFGEVKALDEDWAFINGDGVSKPEGLLTAGIGEVNSGAAAALTYGGIVNFMYTLPAQYRQGASMLMASLTFAAMLKLQDSSGGGGTSGGTANIGSLIFPPNSTPGTVFGGIGLRFSEFMPSVGAGNYPIVYGQFRHYIIAERQDIRIQRLMERFAPNIGVLPTARLGGQLTRTQAFKKLKVAA